MLPRALKGVVILVLGGLVAILLGKMIGEGDYESLLLLCYLSLGIFVLTAPGYLPLLALGLLNPFVFPIPFVYSFPFLAVMFGVCVVKLIFRDALTHTEFRNYQPSLTFWITIFFGWVAMRYLMKPVMPNLSGFGASITGFRSYLSYGICFALLVGLPLFIKTREDVLRLFKWMAGLSVFFILIFVPLTFSKSLTVAMWLRWLGVFVTSFDNGWLRFVVLPGFGLTLITLTLLPTLLPLSKLWRRVLFCVGMAAVIMGGNRSSAIMAVVSVLVITLMRFQFRRFLAISAGLALFVGIGTFLGENIRVKSGFGFWRIMALTSKRVARQTEADGTWEWRKNLWNLAIREIEKNPLFGKGYGGLENAWVFSTVDEYQRAESDLGLASGGLHNGFLATTYALGIPSLIFFVIAYGQVLYRSGRQVVVLRNKDPVLADMQLFIFTNLSVILLHVYIGIDLNSPFIWFYVTLAILLTRMNEPKAVTAPSTESRLPLPGRPATA
jgi:O-antigen ligase